MQEGLYARVSEDGDELNLVSGAPPSFLHCSHQGELPGCLFMFDEVDQQCADNRTGEQTMYVCVFVYVCVNGVCACVYVCLCVCE